MMKMMVTSSCFRLRLPCVSTLWMLAIRLDDMSSVGTSNVELMLLRLFSDLVWCVLEASTGEVRVEVEVKAEGDACGTASVASLAVTLSFVRVWVCVHTGDMDGDRGDDADGDGGARFPTSFAVVLSRMPSSTSDDDCILFEFILRAMVFPTCLDFAVMALATEETATIAFFASFICFSLTPNVLLSTFPPTISVLLPSHPVSAADTFR
mmetsp:Transcript_12379/g.34094  ORF Transcript_12379/g.34094 Transcript_12379/m.34094 type:complete len:209 (+) Transcript_12379:57-683(+)